MFEDTIDLWNRYTEKAAKGWEADSPLNDLTMEIRQRLAYLDIILEYLNRAIVKVVSRDPEPNLRALKEPQLFTEAFYFFAWRLVEALEPRGKLKFSAVKKLSARGVRSVRNQLLQHPEKYTKNFKQSLAIGSTGPVLKCAALVCYPTGRSEPDETSIDRGLFVNAKELHDELLKNFANALEEIDRVP